MPRFQKLWTRWTLQISPWTALLEVLRTDILRIRRIARKASTKTCKNRWILRARSWELNNRPRFLLINDLLKTGWQCTRNHGLVDNHKPKNNLTKTHGTSLIWLSRPVTTRVHPCRNRLVFFDNSKIKNKNKSPLKSLISQNRGRAHQQKGPTTTSWRTPDNSSRKTSWQRP